MTTRDLNGKNILITGASRGIGHTLAIELADTGAELILVSRGREALEELKAEIEGRGGKATALCADFSDPGAVFSLAEEIKALVPRLDVLINNAGQALSAPIEETGPGDWDRIMTINARSPYFLTQQLLPLMEASEIKTVVNIASVVATQGYPLQSAYTMSKHALIGFSKSMARELQERGYRVHVISPGGVNTQMVSRVRPDIDTDELIQTEEIAAWVLFLLQNCRNGMVDHIQIRRESKLPW
ncbi:MAG: SDR family oxidoreductase [Spirochaetales bacterium]|nr:SDR family oxidoreductase [Spirochaetales bacterium]